MRALNKDVIITPSFQTRRSKNVVYLLGGAQSRARRTFEPILEKLQETDTTVFLVDYSNIGLDVHSAAGTLRTHIRQNNYDSVTYIAISLGYIIAAQAARPQDRVIAICPCLGYHSLKDRCRKAAKMLPLVYVVATIMGLLSYTPIIKSNGFFYSLALLADQFGICANRDNDLKCNTPVVVQGTNDNIIRTDIVERSLKSICKTFLYCNAGHFGTGPEDGRYLDAVLPYITPH